MVASAVIDSLAPRDSSQRCGAEAIVVFGRLYGATGEFLYGAVSIFVGGVDYRLRRGRDATFDHSATMPPSARSKLAVKPPPLAR